MPNKPLPILLIFLCFISCKKEPVSSVENFVTGNVNAIADRQPVIADAVDKTVSVLNAYTGATISENQLPGSHLENGFAQAPLFLKDVIIYFYGRTVVALNKKDNSVKWETVITKGNVSSSSTHISLPVIAKNLLMFSYSTPFKDTGIGIYAIDISSGEKKWVNKDFSVNMYTTPTFAQNKLIVNGNGDVGAPGYLFTIDVATGRTNWVAGNSGIISSPSTDSNFVYYSKASGGRDTLFARNVADGSIHWWKVVYNADFWSFITTSKNHLYVNFADTLCCINKNTGALIWKIFTPTSEFSFSALYADSSVLYVNTNGYSNTFLYALNAADGHKIWSVPISTGAEVGPFPGPVVMHDIVYQNEYYNFITAYDKQTGVQIFKTKIKTNISGDLPYPPTFVDENGAVFYSPNSGMY